MLFFDSLDDYDAYREQATLGMELGQTPQVMPPQTALSFERGTDVHPARRKEVKDHGWRVAGPAAYPELMFIEPYLLLRPPTTDDYLRVEALALAFCRLLDREPNLAQAWANDDRCTRRLTLDVRGTQVSVAISNAHAA